MIFPVFPSKQDNFAPRQQNVAVLHDAMTPTFRNCGCSASGGDVFYDDGDGGDGGDGDVGGYLP